MKIFFGIVGLLLVLGFMVIMSDYAQLDKYREGHNDCALYQSQHVGKNCPII